MEVLKIKSINYANRKNLFADTKKKRRQAMQKRTRYPKDDWFKATPELLEELDRIRKEATDENCTVCRTLEDSIKFLDSL